MPYEVDGSDGMTIGKGMDRGENCLGLIEERLGSTLGEAEWEDRESGNCFEDVMVGEFLSSEIKGP